MLSARLFWTLFPALFHKCSVAGNGGLVQLRESLPGASASDPVWAHWYISEVSGKMNEPLPPSPISARYSWLHSAAPSVLLKRSTSLGRRSWLKPQWSASVCLHCRKGCLCRDHHGTRHADRLALLSPGLVTCSSPRDCASFAAGHQHLCLPNEFACQVRCSEPDPSLGGRAGLLWGVWIWCKWRGT